MRTRPLLLAVALAATVAPQPALQAQSAPSISASDRQQGAQAHPQLLAEYGGALQGPAAAYLRQVGQRVAVQSGLSDARSDFTITLLNSNVNNAFAVPGGYVYVTRNLMALANDEAELAFVMGHEIGHVAARHSRKRQTTSTIANVAAGLLGAVFGNSGGLGSLIGRGAGTAAQLYTLGFSRGQETEADDLGVRYITRAGYDPLAAAGMLALLSGQDDLDARLAGRQQNRSSWASTHPDPASRIQRALAQARAQGVRGGERGRVAFLAAIDGMVYGDDPRQGVVDGTTFRHPGLRIAFTAPAGFAVQNGTDAVTVAGQGGQAQFSGGAYTGDVGSYVQRVLGALGGNGQPVNAEVRRGRIAGFDSALATVQANTNNGVVDATVVAYRIDPRTVYHFVLLTPQGAGTGPFDAMLDSFRRLSPAEAANIRGRRIRVVTAGPRDTLQSIASRMAFNDDRIGRFLALNGLRGDERVQPGDKFKLVVYG